MRIQTFLEKLLNRQNFTPNWWALPLPKLIGLQKYKISTKKNKGTSNVITIYRYLNSEFKFIQIRKIQVTQTPKLNYKTILW